MVVLIEVQSPQGNIEETDPVVRARDIALRCATGWCERGRLLERGGGAETSILLPLPGGQCPRGTDDRVPTSM